MNNILFAGTTMMMCCAGIFATYVTDSNKVIAAVSGHGDMLPEKSAVVLYRLDDMQKGYFVSDTIICGRLRLEIHSCYGENCKNLLNEWDLLYFLTS